VKPREKMDWFWTTGTLPGSILDDLNDRRVEQSLESCRQGSTHLRTGTLEHPGKVSEQQRDHSLGTVIETCVAWLADRSIGQ
jgi:hypothetical protein